MGKKTDLCHNHTWRCVEEFVVAGASEHRPEGVTMLIHNTHQPSSKDRPWKATTKVEFCCAIMTRAVGSMIEHSNCIGWAIIGDPNCENHTFDTAFNQLIMDFNWKGVFPAGHQMTLGLGKKGGDIICAAGRENFNFKDNLCSVEGREPQHDPLIL